jgi:hypothetical protein
MAKDLISFPSAAMVFPDEDLQAVSGASHAVVQEATDAGVWVFGGGIDESIPPVMVDGDGTVTQGTYPQTKQLEGGYTVLELPPREAALDGPRRSPLPADARRRCARSSTTPPADGPRTRWLSRAASTRSTSSPQAGSVGAAGNAQHPCSVD